jgi:UDP-N-acetylmuramate--alanine ligase
VLKRSYKRIHFVGIGGSGVSALAHLMLQMGYEVTGSDCQSNSVTDGLQRAGATVWVGHDERYPRMADVVVYSTAIPQDNPELSYARAKGVPMLTRIELLSYLAERHESVVVSGSHGKSTTTSMIATAFMAAQRDPTVVMGSVLKHNIGSARLGKSNVFICEGDESNNSILQFTPRVALVTNIDCDHLDFHGSLSNLKESFIRFLNSPPRGGFSVVCLDDDNIRSIMAKITQRIVTYGFHPDAEYQAQGRRLNGEGGLTFEVHHRQDGPLGMINLRMPGDHNIQNALATVAVCRGLGVSFDTISFALENFPGVCRRYDMLYNNGMQVIDDYAHHPSEIHALLSGVREVTKGRIRAVFQPHRFTRSKNLAQQFPPAFIDADEIILAPIYTANEKPIAGIGIDYLNRFFQRRYDERKLKCMSQLSDIVQYLESSMQRGDVVLTIGAGDVSKVGHALAHALKQRDDEHAAGVDLKRIEANIEESVSFFSEEGMSS